ncbi:MAG: hypothetical protein ACI4Q8_01725 [Ruminococcus sp.]
MKRKDRFDMKRFLSMFLTMSLLLSLFQLSVFAETSEDTDEISNKSLLKGELLEEYYNIVGKAGVLVEGVDYTWNYCDIVETNISTEQGVTPRWSTGNPVGEVTHDIIIDAANEIAREEDGSFVPQKYIALVKEANKICDKGDEDKGITKISAIQATGNYVVTFKYLWQFTKNLSKHKEETVISKTTLNNYIENAHKAGIVGIPSSFRSSAQFIDMNHFVKKMLKAYYDDENFAYEEGQILGKRCKFIMFGIIFHFMGDLYAHRTVVPKNVCKNTNQQFRSSNL